jgi:hypothetical protein
LIPRAYIQAWSAKAPWPDLRQVEQDLIICRALCDLFNASELKGKIAFRGGTAIHKLLFEKPLRYSEDIDLVQNARRTHRRDRRCDTRRPTVAREARASWESNPGGSVQLSGSPCGFGANNRARGFRAHLWLSLWIRTAFI